MAEQPVGSSLTETNDVEVPETPEVEGGEPEVEAAPADQGGDRSRTIPRERFDEINARMKQAEELLTQLLQAPAKNAEPAEPEDPIYGDVRAVKEVVFELKDERVREAFWKENADFAPMQDQVEKELANFRKAGYNVTRDQVMDYALGQKTRQETRTKAAAPRSVTPAINQVAHAESGQTSRKVSVDMSSMNEAELWAHEQKNPGALTAYLRGKTF